MRRSWKDVLENKLTEKELSLVPSSFDIIGNVAIFQNFPEELKKKERLIAEALLKVNKNIETVAKKTHKVSGKYRIRKLKIIYGKRKTETLHKENGYLLKLDPKKVYFSPRESTERERIAQQIKPKENILVMFSGISPICIAIAKKQPKINKIYAIEINPIAHKYALENIKINKLDEKIEAYQGDVRKILPKLKKRFDRIIMPLPKGAYKFLDLAFKYIELRGIIHFYHWSDEKGLYKAAQDLVEKTARKSKKRIKILRKKKVLPYSPRVWKIVLDIKVVS